MVDGLVCSAERCDIHDVGMVIWDEDGKRPKGRNPWEGFCLRLDALKKINNPVVERHDHDREAVGISLDQIRSLVRKEISASVSTKQNEVRAPVRKTGGTPLEGGRNV
tara:strand:+ start:2406 stop:2729 length:324 start_codon:yes stop_codon:yes gene_type:complete